VTHPQHRLSPRLLLLAACGVAACGSSTPGNGNNDADPTGCALDPIGMFTFHVHNVGDRTLAWDLGCMRNLPIFLEVPQGILPTGPGAYDYCEFTCDQIFAGTVTPGGCSDCGPGYSGIAAPGETRDIVWDRRVYTGEYFNNDCRPSAPTPPGATCARGHAVAPSAAQSGTITVCDGTVVQSVCRDSATGQTIATRTVEFTVDTTGTDAVIDVQ
jgi:hypothetical protein